MANSYAVHIKEGHYAQVGQYPVTAVVYRYTNESARKSHVERQAVEEPRRWYTVAASDKLVQHAKFFAQRGASWPVTLIIDRADATPRHAQTGG